MGIALEVLELAAVPTSIPIGPSSVISDVWYTPLTMTLTLLVKGMRLEFHGVSPSVVAGLSFAPSPGKYFNSYIRGAYG